MSPRILLLVTTTSYRAGAFLEAGNRLGVSMVVGTDRKQALADLNPSGHLTLDFGDPDLALEPIIASAREAPFAAVIAADDEGVLLAARAAAALGLHGNPPEAVGRARDKLRMRQALAAAHVPGPAFRVASVDDDAREIARGVPFPCVLKPTFLSGSRGVLRADDAESFVAAFGRVARVLAGARSAAPDPAAARTILIEEYLPGPEVALEGLLTGGRLRALALYDKPDPLEGPSFEETIYVTPSRVGPAVEREVVAATAAVTGALGLDHGPVHAELRLGPQGPRLVEIAPRSIGGLCSRTLRFGDGIALEDLLLMHALGRDVEALEREERSRGVMMIPIPRAGILRRVSGLEEAEAVAGIEEIRIALPVGQEVTPLPEGARYLGFIFAGDASPERVESALRAAHAALDLSIEPVAAMVAADQPTGER